MGEGVRVVRRNEYIDGDRCVGSGVWQDTMMDGMDEHVGIWITS
jgi:hypothetical protein